MLPSVLVAAVTVIGAVCVLTKGPIPAGVSGTFVNVTLTPANKAKNEERPLQCKSEYGRLITPRDERLMLP